MAGVTNCKIYAIVKYISSISYAWLDTPSRQNMLNRETKIEKQYKYILTVHIQYN